MAEAPSKVALSITARRMRFCIMLEAIALRVIQDSYLSEQTFVNALGLPRVWRLSANCPDSLLECIPNTYPGGNGWVMLAMPREGCMMRVLIIGASKGIGLETTRQALEAGHHVRALARSATMVLSDPNLEKIRGDALKTQDVEAALIRVDVVIQTLGVGLGDLFRPVHLFSDATRVLIAAMRTQGVKRLICVTGFGAGESRESISCLQRLPFQIVFGRAYEDKSLQERLIKESGLDWTIARPGVLTGGPRTGRYKILSEASQWRNGIISRSDVAEFLVRQIEDQTYVRQAPVLVN
jgi:putative NADH-flavin reductase